MRKKLILNFMCDIRVHGKIMIVVRIEKIHSIESNEIYVWIWTSFWLIEQIFILYDRKHLIPA